MKKTLARGAGELVSTLGLRVSTTELGSLVITSVAVSLSVTLPAGRDTQPVRTPGSGTTTIINQPAGPRIVLPYVSTPASVGGRRLIIRWAVFLIAVISRETIILTIAHPAGGDTVAILTAKPTLGAAEQHQC